MPTCTACGTRDLLLSCLVERSVTWTCALCRSEGSWGCKAIYGFPGYFAADSGALISVLQRLRTAYGYYGEMVPGDIRLTPPRILRASPSSKTGHLRTRLGRGRENQVWVHRVQCRTWHGPAPDEGMMTIHLDDDPVNNRPSNLWWATQSQNERMKRHRDDVLLEILEEKALRAESRRRAYIPDLALGF